jgi:putative nucleotidyltransferase with HDIG domain
MIGLWEHSIGSAVVARIIAEKKGYKEPEELSVEGLLHDVGKVILMLQFPHDYQKALSEAEAHRRTIADAETDYFAANHATVGAWVAQKWSFPRYLTDVIEYHHKPHLAKHAPLQAAIVHLSDIILRGRGFGFAGDNNVPSVNPATWEYLQLTVEDIKEILIQAEDALEATKDLTL